MNVKKKNWAGYAAFVCGLLYAVPHFWWGLGVSVGFPGDYATAPDEAESRIIGYWIMGALAVFVSLFGLSFVYPWGEKLPRWLKVIPAWVGCVGLSIWGFSFFVLEFQFAIGRVVSAPAFASQDASPMAAWGYVWYALFLGWGISLGFAAYIESKVTKINSHY
ncbi:DUF3995 domain-containing protein [Paenibacillus sp. HJGM_3]|uniref:DUF3995 domain-containing protein n=1 Tax=Paenibacillus sp. HJGM_3 TaxID=3379816 RepID=UPI00385E5A04